MRDDLIIREVLAKCDVLRDVGFWPSERILRPRAWLRNFDKADQGTAALLLDKFNFYNSRLTDALLTSSFRSLGDGLPKAVRPDSPETLVRALSRAVFTPVRGERPNPTDSGYLLCRKVRQILGIEEDRVVDSDRAIVAAENGHPVVFLDDFIGSGDQFLYTWRDYWSNGKTFQTVQSSSGFVAIYIALVATDFGVNQIKDACQRVSLCITHVLGPTSTLEGAFADDKAVETRIIDFLWKYMHRLRPNEEYIARNADFLVKGYKNRGLFFGFEHSIPDATLPIFWSPGEDNWEPLIERT